MKKNLLISSGGSGGHVIPAIAFYDHLKDNFKTFLTLDKRGSKFINKKNYEFEIISTPRLRFNILNLPITIINFIFSFIKFFIFIKKNKIDIVLATGGYMSVPICLAAKILRIKIYLFEPNMVIGRANKFLIKFCNKLFCYSENIINVLKKDLNKIIVVPHILRKEIYNFNNNNKDISQKKITILIVGGSQGAKFFDEELKKSLHELSEKYQLFIYHQVSKLNFKNLDLFYKKNNIKNKLFNFEENIFQYMDKANFAITRAGASTLSELAFFNVPFIAIPYKFATDNHQLENATNYKNNNCCWILEEKEFYQNKLNKLLVNIIENRDDYLQKKNNLEKISYQNTWNNINQKIISSINEN